jgi:hypothetical protein
MHFLTLYQASSPSTPKTDATPTITVYRDRFGASRLAGAPVIRNLGGGCYGFDPSTADEAIGCGYLIDAGAASTPRYAFGTVGNVAVFFALFDGAGAPLATATPAINTYKKPDGTDATPIPAISNMTGGLYGFTPSDSDRVLGVGYEGSSGSASAFPTRFGGVVSDGVITGGGLPAITSTTNAGTVSTTAVPRERDLAFDFKTKKFILAAGDLTLTKDLEAIRQAVQIRCQTFLGEWFLDLEAGIPYFQNVLVKSPNIAAIRQIFRNKIETVPGVVAVTRLDLNFDRQTRSLTLSFSANTDLGEITGTITPPTA